jgi:hypothetical protein
MENDHLGSQERGEIVILRDTNQKARDLTITSKCYAT